MYGFAMTCFHFAVSAFQTPDLERRKTKYEKRENRRQYRFGNASGDNAQRPHFQGHSPNGDSNHCRISDQFRLFHGRHLFCSRAGNQRHSSGQCQRLAGPIDPDVRLHAGHGCQQLHCAAAGKGRQGKGQSGALHRLFPGRMRGLSHGCLWKHFYDAHGASVGGHGNLRALRHRICNLCASGSALHGSEFCNESVPALGGECPSVYGWHERWRRSELHTRPNLYHGTRHGRCRRFPCDSNMQAYFLLHSDRPIYQAAQSAASVHSEFSCNQGHYVGNHRSRVLLHVPLRSGCGFCHCAQ